MYGHSTDMAGITETAGYSAFQESRIDTGDYLAAPQGFEPRYADPESAVLPLNEGANQQLTSNRKVNVTSNVP